MYVDIMLFDGAQESVAQVILLSSSAVFWYCNRQRRPVGLSCYICFDDVDVL